MALRYALIGALALTSLGTASCGQKQGSNANDGSTKSASSAAPAAVAASRHEWTSQDGGRFFYENEDGRLIAVKDLGRLPQDQDFNRALAKGDRAIALEDRQFAARTPGSEVVRVVKMWPGEQVFRSVESVSLSGKSVVAAAMRDSLAGLLTYPSEATLNAQAQTSAPSEKLAVNPAVKDSEPKYSATYNSCMNTGEAADGVTAAMADCNSAELAAQDARLNASYKAAMAVRDAAGKAQIRDAQRVWIKMRDAKCKEGLEGGTMDILTEGGCHLRLTADQADALSKMAK